MKWRGDRKGQEQNERAGTAEKPGSPRAEQREEPEAFGWQDKAPRAPCQAAAHLCMEGACG